MFPRTFLVYTLAVMALTAAMGGCGLFYQAGTRLKASRMTGQLALGESMTQVHNKFGEPDLRQYPNDNTEIWSYAYKPNSNDVAAALLYTSTKEGDQGTFIDLKFVNGKLVSWKEAEHTMPPKERSGFGAGISAPPISGPGPAQNPITHY